MGKNSPIIRSAVKIVIAGQACKSRSRSTRGTRPTKSRMAAVQTMPTYHLSLLDISPSLPRTSSHSNLSNTRTPGRSGCGGDLRSSHSHLPRWNRNDFTPLPLVVCERRGGELAVGQCLLSFGTVSPYGISFKLEYGGNQVKQSNLWLAGHGRASRWSILTSRCSGLR